ncbi:MAG TPA: hypothetical protein VGK32_15010 [Vicinamibacterales bacterium]
MRRQVVTPTYTETRTVNLDGVSDRVGDTDEPPRHDEAGSDDIDLVGAQLAARQHRGR